MNWDDGLDKKETIDMNQDRWNQTELNFRLKSHHQAMMWMGITRGKPMGIQRLDSSLFTVVSTSTRRKDCMQVRGTSGIKLLGQSFVEVD